MVGTIGRQLCTSWRPIDVGRRSIILKNVTLGTGSSILKSN